MDKDCRVNGFFSAVSFNGQLFPFDYDAHNWRPHPTRFAWGANIAKVNVAYILKLLN